MLSVTSCVSFQYISIMTNKGCFELYMEILSVLKVTLNTVCVHVSNQFHAIPLLLYVLRNAKSIPQKWPEQDFAAYTSWISRSKLSWKIINKVVVDSKKGLSLNTKTEAIIIISKKYIMPKCMKFGWKV